MIDQGETWCAAIGIMPILTKRTEEITAKQKKTAATTEERIARLCKSLLNGSIVPWLNPSVDYFKVLDLTSEAIDIPQIVAMIHGIPDEAQLPYMTVARKVYSTIANSIPKSGQKTLTGAERFVPNETAMLLFQELYAAMDDPIRYSFGAISDGSLTVEVMTALKAVYPTLTDYISECIQTEISLRGKGKAFDLPWKVTEGLLSWLGAPKEEPIAPPPTPPQEPEKAGEGESSDKSDMTPSERVDAGVK